MSKIEKQIANFCVIYFLLVVFLTVEVFRTEIKEFEKIMNQMLPLILLYFYPSFYLGTFVGSRKVKNNQNRMMDYYERQFPDVNGLKRENKLTGYHYAALGVLGFALLVIIFVILEIFHNELWVFFEEIHKRIWAGQTYSSVISIVIGIYAFLFTFFPIIITYLNNKSLFFHPFDLPVLKRSKRITIISLIVIITYIVLWLMGVKENWLGICEGIWILLIIFNIIAYVWMFTMPINLDKRVLNRIDRLFNRKEIYMTSDKIWWKGSVIKQISIFLNDYNKVLGKIEKDDIESVEFVSLLARKKENMDFAKKRLYIIIGIIVALLLYVGLVVPIGLNEQQKIVYLVLSLLASMPFIIPLSDKNIIIDNYAFINQVGYISTWGYYIKLVDKQKGIYITPYDFSFSRYRKCLINLKKIVCFYNLAIHMKYNDSECIDNIGIECLCAYVIDLSKRNKYRKGLIVPILICVCLSDNGQEKNRVKVKEMLKQINISDSEKTMSIEMSLYVLRDLQGNDLKYNSMKYEMELEQLFD